MISESVIPVVVADPQFLTAEACCRLIKDENQYKLVGIATSKYEILKHLGSLGTGVLIIDFALFGFESIYEFKDMLFLYPGVSVLVLTNTFQKNDLIEFNKAGFKNLLYKSCHKSDFFAAIESTYQRKKSYSPDLLDLMFDLGAEKQRGFDSKTLTSSEIEIVKLISQGLTTKEIAAKRHVSFHTVNTHRKNIFRKLGISNTSELIMQAVKSGWIDTIEYYI